MPTPKRQGRQGHARPPAPADGVEVIRPLEPGKSRVSLLTLADVRRELATLYRATKAGKVATQDATRMAYLLATLAKVIEQSAIEARIAALEAMTDELR